MAVTRSRSRQILPYVPYDIWVHIFSMINMLDRVTHVPAVCKDWRSAASDERLSKTLDIRECKAHVKSSKTKRRAKADAELAFVRGINIGRLNLTTLIFDPSFRVGKRHLQLASQRCPNLQNLVLPLPQTTKAWSGLGKAFQCWERLESLHIPYRGYIPPVEIFETIGLKCPKLRILKISCWVFEEKHIKAIAKFMPNLKVLCVRNVIFNADVIGVFSSIENSIEEVYLSVIHGRPQPTVSRMEELQSETKKARRLKNFPEFQVFHVCKWQICSELCMAFNMENPPLNIAHPLPFVYRF